MFSVMTHRWLKAAALSSFLLSASCARMIGIVRSSLTAETGVVGQSYPVQVRVDGANGYPLTGNATLTIRGLEGGPTNCSASGISLTQDVQGRLTGPVYIFRGKLNFDLTCYVAVPTLLEVKAGALPSVTQFVSFIPGAVNAQRSRWVALATNAVGGTPIPTVIQLADSWGNPVLDLPEDGILPPMFVSLDQCLPLSVPPAGTNDVGFNPYANALLSPEYFQCSFTAPSGTHTVTYPSAIDGALEVDLVWQGAAPPPSLVYFQSASSSVNEPVSGTAVHNVVLERTGTITGAITAVLSLGGTATEGADYTVAGFSAPSTVTAFFPANISQVTVPITVSADTIYEGDQTVAFTIQPDVSYSIGNNGTTQFATRTVTITDDVNDAALLSFAQPSSSVVEPGSPLHNVTVNYLGTIEAPMTIIAGLVLDVGASSAVRGSDFTNISPTFAAYLPGPNVHVGSVTFSAGNYSANIQLQITDDVLPESDETIVFRTTTIMPPPPNVPGGPYHNHTVTLLNDPTDTPVVTFNNAFSSVNEPEPGTFLHGMQLTRTGDTSVPLTVTISVGGTATQVSDYTLPSYTSVTFSSGQIQTTLPVTINADSLSEGNETIIITLVDDPSYDLGATQQHTVTINDDPTDLSIISFNLAGSSPTEPNIGNTVHNINLTRTGDTSAAMNVTFSLAGTATQVTDYTLPNYATVSFAAGSAAVSLPMTLLSDTLFEGNETAVVTLIDTAAYNLGAIPQHTVTISDDIADTPVVTFVLATSSPNEPNVGTVLNNINLTRTGDTSAAMNVTFSLAGTATQVTDYTLPNYATVSFAAGSAAVSLPMTLLSDTLFEGNETAVITLVDTAAYNLGAIPQHTVTISDDAADFPVVTFALATSSPNEPNVGTVLNNINLTRTGDTSAAMNVTFSLAGTATQVTDYTLPNYATVSFAAGSAAVSLPMTLLSDTLFEGNETAVVTLIDTAAYNLGAIPQHTVTISDDPADAIPTARIVMFSGPASIAEPGPTVPPAVFKILLDQPAPAVGACVQLVSTTTAAFPANFSVAPAPVFNNGGVGMTVNFASGETEKTYSMAIIDDNIFQGTRDITYALQPASVCGGSGVLAAVHSVQNIISYPRFDDEILTVQFTTTAASGLENIANPANVIIQLSHTTVDPVDVYCRSTNGTAIAPADFSAISVGTVCASTTSAVIMNPLLNIVNDLNDEPDENLQLTITGATQGTVQGNTVLTYTILDNDDPPLVYVASAATVTLPEGTFHNVIVELNNASTNTVTTNFTIPMSLAYDHPATPRARLPDPPNPLVDDYFFSPFTTTNVGTVTFNPGVTQQTVRVDAINDTRAEYAEEMQFLLTSATNATVYPPQRTVDFTIPIDPADGNLPPECTGCPITLTMDEDTPLFVDLSAYVTDPEGDTLTYTCTAGSCSTPNGEVSLLDAATGHLGFTPRAHYSGAESFTVTVSDGPNSVPITINLTIQPVNDLPDMYLSGLSDGGVFGLTPMYAENFYIVGGTNSTVTRLVELHKGIGHGPFEIFSGGVAFPNDQSETESLTYSCTASNPSIVSSANFLSMGPGSNPGYITGNLQLNMGSTAGRTVVSCSISDGEYTVVKDFLAIADSGTPYTFGRGNSTAACNSRFGGGTGTQNNPYLITTLAHFNNMRYCGGNSSTHFRMATLTLDMTGFSNPIGHPLDVTSGSFNDSGTTVYPVLSFRGVLDGNGAQLMNVAINRPTLDHVGIFGFIGVGGVVKHLSISAPTGTPTVVGRNFVGALAGWVNGMTMDIVGESSSDVRGARAVGGIAGGLTGHLEAVRNDGSVSGASMVGGLAGYAHSSRISSSATSGTISLDITSRSGFVGGLVGLQFNGRNLGGPGTYFTGIDTSSSTATVTSSGYAVGGLAGFMRGGIRHSYFAGEVAQSLNPLLPEHAYATGGLAGFYESGNFQDNFVRHDLGTPTTIVSGVNAVGGLTGWHHGSSVVTSFSATAVSGTGLFVSAALNSRTNFTVNEVLWEQPINTYSHKGTVRTAAQMIAPSTYTSLWDWSNLLGITWAPPVGNYPTLYPRPVILSFSPRVAPCTGAVVFTINGYGFDVNSADSGSVRLGTSDSDDHCSISAESSTQITCTADLSAWTSGTISEIFMQNVQYTNGAHWGPSTYSTATQQDMFRCQ